MALTTSEASLYWITEVSKVMEITLAQQAIACALSSSWEEAKRINIEILKNSPEDVDALNRLARACAELDDLKSAKKYSQEVLNLDPTNNIASKCLEKWGHIKKGEKHQTTVFSGDSFLEEPGKTKLVSLLFLGDTKTLAKLNSGDSVEISPSAHRVSILTTDGKYIGRLSDDMSLRLRNLIKMGNKYQVLIKSVGEDGIKVFIREIKKGDKAKDIQSFQSEKIDYISFTPPELIHKTVALADEVEGTQTED